MCVTCAAHNISADADALRGEAPGEISEAVALPANAPRQLAAAQHFGRFRSEADFDAGIRPLRGILAGTGWRILRQPGSSRGASWVFLVARLDGTPKTRVD